MKYQISLKSFHWEQSCSMRIAAQIDRHTDMTKIIVAFRNFEKAPENFQYSVA